MKKKVIIFLSVLFLSLLVGYRIQQIREEGVMVVHNIVRIHAQKGVPKEYAVAKKTTDFLEEPLYVKNGRALVSTSRVRKFRAGQKIKDKNSAITRIGRHRSGYRNVCRKSIRQCHGPCSRAVRIHRILSADCIRIAAERKADRTGCRADGRVRPEGWREDYSEVIWNK